MQVHQYDIKCNIMKSMFLILFILSITFIVNGQDNINYINKELSILDNHLTKKGENFKLSNFQISECTSILTDKYLRIEALKSKKPIKDQMSKELIKIENEFQPRILGVLSLEQRSAISSVYNTGSSY